MVIELRTRLTKLFPLIILLAILFLFPLFAPSYQIFLLSYALLLALTALGYNLLFGKAGLLSFGHAAYFGLGAYVPGFLTTYTSIRSLEIWLILSIAVSAIIGALIGYVCVKYTRIHFALLTLAFSMMFYSLLFKFYDITRGDDGLYVAMADILGTSFKMSKDAYIAGPLYYATLIIFLILVGVGWIIYNSPFGKTLEAIGNNSARVEFLGVPVKRYKWYAFIISSIYGGIAGCLFGVLSGHVSPTALHWVFSGEIVFMCVLGGTRLFIGPIVGALLFTYIKTYTITFTIYWQLLFGSILVILVLLFPKGVLGGALTLLRRSRGEKVGLRT
jgi:branched-chain amino acid transport system permease protein